MNKGQGLFAGLILAAALLLRPAGVSDIPNGERPQTPQVLPGSSGNGPYETGKQKEGPWLASCSYWAPFRQAEVESLAKANASHSTDSSRSIHEVAEAIRAENPKAEDPGCSADHWGRPDPQIRLTPIIGTIPDPSHTHFSLLFDRYLDSILQAAADDNYVISTFWLPWQRRSAVLKGLASPGDEEPGHDPVREREPGLIILRHVPQGKYDKKTHTYSGEYTSFNPDNRHPIYLFLVAESPTKGVDGFQLQNAFKYEQELLPKSGKKNPVYIIGPDFTGSAEPLREGIEVAYSRLNLSADFRLAGMTAASFTYCQLVSGPSVGSAFCPNKQRNEPIVSYYSFGSNSSYTDDILNNELASAGFDTNQLAVLVEDKTAFGTSFHVSGGPKTISFPREISLLRNTEVESESSSNNTSLLGAIPSPYLHFSAKDSGAQDAAPQFSLEQTPLSQEARLLMIARQLRINGYSLIRIQASNPLDDIFLARFLHGAYPDAQLFIGADILLTRDSDNAPFVGSISLTSYPLMGLSATTVPESSAEYNAAAYIFHQALGDSAFGTSTTLPGFQLLGYQPWPDEQNPRLRLPPPLWATALGHDGYYPLGILSFDLNSPPGFLPEFDVYGHAITQGAVSLADSESAKLFFSRIKNHKPYVYPAISWRILSWIVIIVCCGHALLILTASFWSTLTRDLVVVGNESDQRRSLYIQVATAALLLTCLVLALPVLALGNTVSIGLFDKVTMWTMFLCGLGVEIVTGSKTFSGLRWKGRNGLSTYSAVHQNLSYVMLRLAWLATVLLAAAWWFMCFDDKATLAVFAEGVSFSYRCLYPLSGVSPVLPVIILLVGWYIWAFLQTWRMRFSHFGRPHLSKRLDIDGDNRFFVSDEDVYVVRNQKEPMLRNSKLCNKIESGMFTLTMVRGAFQNDGPIAESLWAGLCILIFVCLFLFHPFTSFDHFLWRFPSHSLSSPFEIIVGLLLFPLIWVSFAGWMRLIIVWSFLKRNLLSRLEDLPIRFAFNRLNPMNWMTLLSRAGLQDQWRDMDRCIESIVQMLNDPQFLTLVSVDELRSFEELRAEILVMDGELRQRKLENTPGNDIADHRLLRKLDKKLAYFGQKLLAIVLIPWWKEDKIGLVDSRSTDEPRRVSAKQTSSQPDMLAEFYVSTCENEPAEIIKAEEFIAIRYVSFVRAVLTNMRYSMTLVSLTFVLTMLAWNSYPFQPREIVDWLFTGFLLVIGAGMVWVFAQIHRDPILSRITDSKPNQLGLDFWFRIFSYGAIPVITWITYEYPDIGASLYRWIQPSTELFK